MSISQILKEKANAKELSKIYPCSVCYDMIHNFVHAKKPHGYLKQQDGDTYFVQALYKQHFVGMALNTTEYQMQLPQNQVLLHGIIYNALFNIYVKYAKKSFDSVHLVLPQMQQDEGKTVLDWDEHNDLPRQYRDLFLKYYREHYVLNTNYGNMVMSYANKNKGKLEILLKRAQELIPAIYREPTPNVDFGGAVQIYDSPDFVGDSKDARRVTDRQLNTIRELHDIFVDISKISLPCPTLAPRKQHVRPSIIATKESANVLYNKYLQEQAQQNIVYNACQEYKKIKKHIIENEPSLPAKTIRGKEILRTKEMRFLLKNRKKAPHYMLTTTGQKCRVVHDFILNELKKKLKTYTR